jgi:hypothetical protein
VAALPKRRPIGSASLGRNPQWNLVSASEVARVSRAPPRGLVGLNKIRVGGESGRRHLVGTPLQTAWGAGHIVQQSMRGLVQPKFPAAAHQCRLPSSWHTDDPTVYVSPAYVQSARALVPTCVKYSAIAAIIIVLRIVSFSPSFVSRISGSSGHVSCQLYPLFGSDSPSRQIV